MTTTQTLITAEELAAMPEGDVRRELVRGEIVEMSPVKRRHGRTTTRILVRLEAWAEETQSGEVGTEVGFFLARNPDTVRAPDVYFVRHERVVAAVDFDAYWDGPPDLAVEVVSRSETAEDVQDKVDDYLRAGAQLVWVLYPKKKQVVEYLANGQARVYQTADVLTNEAVLPGFTCRVADLFD